MKHSHTQSSLNIKHLKFHKKNIKKIQLIYCIPGRYKKVNYRDNADAVDPTSIEPRAPTYLINARVSMKDINDINFQYVCESIL